MGAQKKHDWLDLFVIDNSGNDKVMNLERFITFGEKDVKSVKGLVKLVKQLCDTKGKKVRRLRISGHGNSSGAYVGADWISLKTLPKHEPDLKKLKPYFVAPTSRVIFDACQTGADVRLLTRLSQLWGGIRVTGFFDNQQPNFISPDDEGTVVTCQVNACRFSTPGSDVGGTVRVGP
jgi:hypothetical protein